MEITASSVTRKQFTKKQRGYDTKEVSNFLDQVGTVMAGYERDLNQLAGKIEQLQERLVDAKQAEEAVKLTILAASKAKEEMLSKAQSEADKMVDAAVKEAAAIRAEHEAVEARTEEMLAEAKEQAVRIVAEADVRADARTAEADAEAQERVAVARREALALLEDTRVDAEQLINAAISEESELQQRLEELRTAIEVVEEPLQAIASGALDELMSLKQALPAAPVEPVVAHVDEFEEAVAEQARLLDPPQDFEIVRVPAETAPARPVVEVETFEDVAEGSDEAAALMELAYAEGDA